MKKKSVRKKICKRKNFRKPSSKSLIPQAAGAINRTQTDR